MVFDLARDKQDEELIQDKALLIQQYDQIKSELDEIKQEGHKDELSKSMVEAF